MITFTLETITPEKAEEYLRHNVNNRNLHPTRVKALQRDIEANAFLVTHQCIAFNAMGDLIDGQHRLWAIIESGITVQMYVARYERTETAMALPFDMGLTRKTHDILDISRKASEIASAILRLKWADRKFTPHDIQACMERHGNSIQRVMTECSSHTSKHRSSAGAKAAVVLLVEHYPDDVHSILQQYNKMLLLDLDGMWPSVAACIKSLDNFNGSGGGAMQRAIAIRVYYALQPRHRDLKLIRIMNEGGIIDEMVRNLD